MKSNRKAILVTVLALIMSLMPVQAFATDQEGLNDQTGTDTAAAETTDNTETAAEEEPAPAPKPAPAPVVKKGWQTENGAKYYYNSAGKRITGVRKVGGKVLYFDKTGKYTPFKGWKTINGARYYGLGDKGLAVKPTLIKTKVKEKTRVKVKKKKYKTVTRTVNKNLLYMFQTNGKLRKTKGLFKYNGKEYYGAGNGVLKTKWVAFKEKKKDKAAYFDPKTGAMKKGGKVKYLEIPKNGRLGEAYALGVRKLDKTKWTLRQAYKNSYKIKYKNRWYRRKTAEQYAIRGFKKNNGNCFVMASTFYIQAKLLGYNVHQIKGKVNYHFPHSWTIIRQNGKWWVYDPNFRNETGRSGWKIWYGKKGTWRYMKYHRMN